MSIVDKIKDRLTSALEAKAAALEEATGRLERLDEVAPLGDLFGPVELDALDERRLWDDTVKGLTAGVDPEFESQDEAHETAVKVATFAESLVLMRRQFFAGGGEDEQ